MGPRLLGRHFPWLRGASTPAIVVAALGSFVGQVAAVVQGAPLWLYVLVALAPWIPVLALELAWVYRHYRWLAVFCLLIVTQSAYLLEQVARMVQVHVLGRSAQDAPGMFGALDVERLQVLWLIWATLGALILVTRFPRNPWLVVTLLLVASDTTSRWLLRLDLDVQFVLSVAETGVLNVAFAYQLGRTYDAWLGRAFPELPERVLIETTGRLAEIRLRPGERIEYASQCVYIVTQGTAVVTRQGPGGHEILLDMVGPGQIVADAGTVRAETPLELLAVPCP